MSMLSTLSQRLLNYSIKKSLTKLRWLGELSQIVLHHFICPVHWRSTLCPFVTKDVYPKENRENSFSTVLISSWNHKIIFKYSQWAWILKIADFRVNISSMKHKNMKLITLVFCTLNLKRLCLPASAILALLQKTTLIKKSRWRQKVFIRAYWK